MSTYETADETAERTPTPPHVELDERRVADIGSCPPRGRDARDHRGPTAGRARWAIGMLAACALIALFVPSTGSPPSRLATTTPMTMGPQAARTPTSETFTATPVPASSPTAAGELSPEPPPVVAPTVDTPEPTPREDTASIPPPATARPAILASTARAAMVAVEPAAVVESIPTASPYSPLITFTVENTGASVAVLGRVITTDAVFRLARDDCSRTNLAPHGMCHVTLQFVPRTPGRYVGRLVVPVDGSPARTASLRANAT